MHYQWISSPHFKTSLVEAMQSFPYALPIDGSNDNRLEKMKPHSQSEFLTWKIKRLLQISLDMCLTSGDLWVAPATLSITVH